MLKFEDIVGYLHHYAFRYENATFEHWELINEAWIVVHKLNHIQFASQGIRWAMMSYKAKENQRRRYGSSTARILPISTDAGINKLVKEMIAKPSNYEHRTDTIDTISWLADNACLSMSERILIDQRFGRQMTQSAIARVRNCTRQNISQRIKITIYKLCCAARRLERRELVVHT